jgi:DNA-binding response OmpR family regulator
MKSKILVIDDDKVTLTMLEMILSRNGYKVLSANDGAQGYDLAAKEKPDAVISDMLIPKIHGLELCTKIRENPLLQDTKIILMTAVYKGATFQFQAKESGADYFIEKPIDTKGLLDKLKELLTAP